MGRFLFSEAMLKEIRLRISVYTLTIFFIWPLFSSVMAAMEIRKIPYHSVSGTTAIWGSLAGAFILLPDFLVIGTLSMLMSLLLFSILASIKLLRTHDAWLSAELVLIFIAILFGTSLHYPGALSHPFLAPLSPIPVWTATLLLGAVIFAGSFLLAAPGSGLRVLAVILAIGILTPIPVTTQSLWISPKVGKAPLVLLGLDSLSQHDNLIPLRRWAVKNDGTWYSRAVPPGLLTNSVWTSLLAMQPVRSHGVFHIFQSSPRLGEKGTLIEKAQQAGYRTISVFPDQFTCWVGEHSGFEEERNGPIGWRQIATSHVENASLLLPLFRPLFPRRSFSSVPPNHSGTFTYNIDRELDEIFTASYSDRLSFVAAHLTYLHTPVFPRYTELSWPESMRVMTADVKSVRDRSFDWQDIDLPTDPIQLHKWKIQRLQEAVVESAERTKFFERDGQLLLFSDHGNRTGMTVNNFWKERYHRVLLLTFGLPTRNPNAPISLLDAGFLLGLSPDLPSFEAVVEFTLSEPSEWPALINTSRLHFDGSVELDQEILALIFQRLRSYRPWPKQKAPTILPVFDPAG